MAFSIYLTLKYEDIWWDQIPVVLQGLLQQWLLESVETSRIEVPWHLFPERSEGRAVALPTQKH